MLDANDHFFLFVIGQVPDNQEGRPSIDLHESEGYNLQVFSDISFKWG